MQGPGSARDGLSRVELAMLLAALAALGLAMAWWDDPLFVAAALLSPLFLVQALYTLGAALERPASGETAPADMPDWPRYTVLVPLYREAGMASRLVDALSALDYPRDRLEVLFLVEVDDQETAEALERCPLPPRFRIAVVPPGGPKTKPNALNHGLGLANGDLLTVYDAEDAPDPQQLRKAAAMFARLPPEIVCLQARLAIDNPSDGWLSLMMTIEYAGLFDATKCGFAAMAMPVALGGTSNHFQASALREVGGWDAWNVAEDADMGLRLARAGRSVADLPSVTREEAPFRLRSWFSQRRRWHKGFLQTTITHMRRTGSAVAAAGWVGWVGGMVQVAGSFVGALLYPLFATHMAWLLATGGLFENADVWSAARNTMALWVACCGLLAMFAPALIGLNRRRAWHLAPWLLTMPLYQVVISAAAWVAILDYIRAPSRWLKTEHGGADRAAMAGPLVRSRPEWRT